MDTNIGWIDWIESNGPRIGGIIMASIAWFSVAAPAAIAAYVKIRSLIREAAKQKDGLNHLVRAVEEVTRNGQPAKDVKTIMNIRRHEAVEAAVEAVQNEMKSNTPNKG